MERSRRRRRLLGGALAGGLAGLVAGAVIAAAAPSMHEQGEPDVAVDSIIDAAHVPPFLTLPGEPVTLRYAIVCPGPEGDPFGGAPCDASGDVLIRAGSAGPFTRMPLRRTGDSFEGRYVLDVPPGIAGSPDGFSYYAVLRSDATGAAMIVPSGGADAPQRSLPLERAITIELGSHRFDSTRPADERVVEAPWGGALGRVGLAAPPGGLRIGPSSFDVAADGAVVLLDGVNSRLERWSRGRVLAVTADLDGALDDLAVAPDGSAYVLDGRGRPPLLRHLGRDGRLIAAEPIAERTWSQLRLGPDGPVVQQAPSEQWLRAAPGLGRAAKARSGRSGRPFADGSEIVVLRKGIGELRLARVLGGQVRSAWRIVSDTPLGEVQLAQPSGNRLVVVVKAYTDAADEFVVLILDGRGVARQFSLPSSQWAASAGLARFRVAGSSLYQLGSTAEAAFVDRYDLGVNR
jgi:hypothetical protein